MEPDMNTGKGVRVRHDGEGASDMGARRISGMEARRARARRDGWARRSARPPRRSERGRWASSAAGPMRERRELGRGTGMGRAEEKEERATRMEKGKRRGEKVGRWEEIRLARENHGPEARLAQFFSNLIFLILFQMGSKFI